MVTAGNGMIIFAAKSGRQYSLSFYSSDVVGAACTFNTSGLAVAGSQTFFIIPEDSVIKDISFTSTNTVSTAFVPYVNDVPSGVMVSIANVLNSLAYRAIPNLGIAAGRKFTLIQA
jgi:hypothetical protein